MIFVCQYINKNEQTKITKKTNKKKASLMPMTCQCRKCQREKKFSSLFLHKNTKQQRFDNGCNSGASPSLSEFQNHKYNNGEINKVSQPFFGHSVLGRPEYRFGARGPVAINQQPTSSFLFPAHLQHTSLPLPRLHQCRAIQWCYGSVGPQGPVGPVGPQGPDGERGVSGADGAVGPTGPMGPDGAVGGRGADGVIGPMGPTGPVGEMGPIGPVGVVGPIGPTGATGAAGVIGTAGAIGGIGPAGPIGPTGASGPDGAIGPAGPSGAIGPMGPQGPPGIVDFAEFYALMPTDNAGIVGPGMPVQFPNDGETSGIISRYDASSFILSAIGVYHIWFQVSVTGTGQLIVATSNDGGNNYTELSSKLIGRAANMTQIVGSTLVRATVVNTLLQIRNPAGNNALTITPYAGSFSSDTVQEEQPVSANLIIARYA